jgi:cellulose biosynthesis protein BcsQ
VSTVRILATYNIKGGVGKTAAAVNLAWLAARDGYRTLVWDLDPQGAASYYFRVRPKVKGGSKGLLKGRRELDEAVRGSDFPNLDLIPADFSFRNLDLALADTKRPVKQLLRLLRPLGEDYDLLFLDCPPSISLVSENVFHAADALVIPLIPTTLSLRTYDQLLAHLGKSGLDRLTLLPFFSMADRRKRLHLETMARLRERDPRVLPADIPYASVVELMGERRAPVAAFAPRSPAAVAYGALWREVVERL